MSLLEDPLDPSAAVSPREVDPLRFTQSLCLVSLLEDPVGSSAAVSPPIVDPLEKENGFGMMIRW